MLIIATMSASASFAAGGNHGEDARSQSMSVDTGEEPIPDMSVTQDPGAEDNGVLGDLFGDRFTDIPWRKLGMYASGAALVIVLIVLIVKIIGSRDPAKAERRREERRRKKLDRGYKGKH